MATRRGIALRRSPARTGGRSLTGTRPLRPAETAWLLLVPAVALSLVAIAALGPPLGRLAFTGAHATFWPAAAQEQLRPKPTELARFALTVVCSLAFVAAIPLAAARPLRMPPRRIRAAVAAVELLAAGALVLFFVAQGFVARYDLKDPRYFTPPTLAAAGLIAALGAVALTRPALVARLRARPVGVRWSVACVALAALVTVLWLLPSIYTDRDVAFAPTVVPGHLQFGFDEAMSVLDGRSPLVNMATYGALVPYLVALPLAAFHGALAAYTASTVALTALALLGIYGVLRRLTRSALAALALYVPFLATSLFIVRGDVVERFTYSSYAGVFPIRYAGPYLLAWLLARHLDGARPRSATPLFAAAGLVVLNNTDFGLPALGATLLAVVLARPPRNRSAALALAGRIAAGLGIAYALVALLTLLRAGTLPHLDRLFAYARLFGVAGFGNLPTPLLGFHLAILATFLAAAATAAVRAAARRSDATLTGMLAWCGVFGLGTGAYFVYRSHPSTLIASFSIWALTVAVLLVAVGRAAIARGALAPSPPVLALLAGFGLAVCSIAQFPLPWAQVQRIARTGRSQPLAQPEAVGLVRRLARPGATVAILTPIGHRVAYDAGVTNVTAYTGMPQMPTVDQLRETVRALRAGHGTLLFATEYWAEIFNALDVWGFRPVAVDRGSGVVAFRARR